MIFVLDTNSLSVLRNYYPASFPSLWSEITAVTQNGTLRSVREVYNELLNDNRSPFVQEWAKQNKAIFARPSRDEISAVREILAVRHFQSVIGARAMLKGTPVADPFLVASALVNEGIVITEEVRRPNAARVPNICEYVDVEFHNLEWFMVEQGWEF